MEIVFATANQNKIREVQQLMPSTIKILGLNDIDCTEDIPETSATIEGNALQKATYVFENYKVTCFADDTGLEVHSLNGAPGVYSARYAGEEKNSEKNMNKLLQELKPYNDRSAQFKTVIALVGINEKPLLFEGICAGEILLQQQGDEGFGYDPIFQPKGFQKSFAEMSLANKNKISHRGIAVKKLIDFFETLDI